MTRSLSAIVLLSSLTLANGGATATEPRGATPACDGAVAALLALGPSITPAGAAGYIAQVPDFGADESVAALAVLARFVADPASGPQIGSVATALRHHVEGLRISGETVAGLRIDSCGPGGPAATFDPRGAGYTGVTLVYSGDYWSSAHAAVLTRGQDGLWRTSLPGLASDGSIQFAVELDQPGGDTLWLNNPREPRPGAASHVDFSQALALCEPVAAPTSTPLAQLVRAFARPESLGGATFTLDEVSWLVAQATYEGGPGVDDPDVIDATIAALDSMKAAGAAFEGDAYEVARNFLANQRMARVSSTDAVTLQRNPQNQLVQVTAPLGSQWMRVYYSTDGWDLPKVAECLPSGRLGYVSCPLGYMPADALLSFSAIVRTPGGTDQYVHASDGGKLFGKLR